MEESIMRPARIPLADHLARPWRVHALAPDFELLDVWRFGSRGRADDFPAFARTMAAMDGVVAQTNWATRALFGLRVALGKVLRWDRERAPLPIPGCVEHSITARLPDGLDATAPRSDAAFHPVYEDPRESLAEISNSTVHALMHLGWIELDGGEFAPQMAVYVKHRGMLGRFYMRLIAPFRHMVVYPSLMRAVDRSWRARIGAGARSPRPQAQAILHDG
jgi:hypothetical protein